MIKELGARGSLYLDPGYMCCLKKPGAIHTVVGACCVVCLWDRTHRYGGMNHFLYPATSNTLLATPKFGNVATLGLIKLMEEAGSRREDLVAQILGGASPLDRPHLQLGMKNVQAARDVLERKHVFITSQDVGGHMGRKIIFDTGTGHIMILKVHHLRQEDWMMHCPG